MDIRCRIKSCRFICSDQKTLESHLSEIHFCSVEGCNKFFQSSKARNSHMQDLHVESCQVKYNGMTVQLLYNAVLN